jgi:HEPN domain-containing protein
MHGLLPPAEWNSSFCLELYLKAYIQLLGFEYNKIHNLIDLLGKTDLESRYEFLNNIIREFNDPRGNKKYPENWEGAEWTVKLNDLDKVVCCLRNECVEKLKGNTKDDLLKASFNADLFPSLRSMYGSMSNRDVFLRGNLFGGKFKFLI